MFVRHALPDERVAARVTETRPAFWRADALVPLAASPDRVEPPCPYARPGLCGGCDLQHASVPAQLAWKAAVVREQLSRLAGLSWDVRVEALPGGPLHWRSRVRYAVSPDGVPGLRVHRSHEIVPIDRCLIAHPLASAVLSRLWPGVSTVEVVVSGGVSGDSDVTVLADGDVVSGPPVVREHAVGREWTFPAGVFWQVHPRAADTLASTVLTGLAPVAGETAWDLYGGVGLFAAALADRGASVTLVESDPRAVAVARELPGVRAIRGRVERVVGRLPVPSLVVLDPPRTGAGAAVVRAIAAAGPRAVAYVACDPAAFARDVGTFRSLGWRLADLRAFDLFPMTHHVECVGLLLPDDRAGAG